MLILWSMLSSEGACRVDGASTGDTDGGRCLSSSATLSAHKKGATESSGYWPTDVVVVAVVTYNSENLLPDFIASLPAGFGQMHWHLVLVDNNSADGTVDAARRLAPSATIIECNRNSGYAAAINVAVRLAPAHSAVLVLNPDVRLLPNCVPLLAAALLRPGTGIAVPRLSDGTGQLIFSMRREPSMMGALTEALRLGRRFSESLQVGEIVTDPAKYETEMLTEWAEGSTQLISASCWAIVGEWDESFFLYSEETEYHLRARDLGFATRYVPSAGAVHLEGASRSSPALWALLVVNRVRLYRRRNGIVRGIAFWGIAVLREGIRGCLGRRTNRSAFCALFSPSRMFGNPGANWIA